MEPIDPLLRPPPPSQAATPYERAQEDARNMAAYEARVASRAEERRREAAQAELEQYLNRRGVAFIDATGASEVPRSLLEGWSAEFAGQKAAEQEAERAALVDSTRGQIF